MTHAPPAHAAKRPAKADLDEAVAWLRILWTLPISNDDIEGFFRWSRDKPAARAVYDDLSRRIHEAMMAEAPATTATPQRPSGRSGP